MILFCPNCGEKNCFEIFNFVIDLKNDKKLWENNIYIIYKCNNNNNNIKFINLNDFIYMLKLQKKFNNLNNENNNKNINKLKYKKLSEFYDEFRNKNNILFNKILFYIKLKKKYYLNNNFLDNINSYFSINNKLYYVFSKIIEMYFYNNFPNNFYNSLTKIFNLILNKKNIIFEPKKIIENLYFLNYKNLYFLIPLTIIFKSFQKEINLFQHKLPIVGLYETKNNFLLTGSYQQFIIWKKDKIFSGNFIIHHKIIEQNLVCSFIEIDNDLIAYSSYKTIKEFNLKKLDYNKIYNGLPNSVDSIIILCDKKFIAGCGIFSEIFIYSRENGNLIHKISKHSSFVNFLYHLNNYNQFLSAGTEGNIFLFEYKLNNNNLEINCIQEFNTKNFSTHHECLIEFNKGFCSSTINNYIIYFEKNNNNIFEMKKYFIAHNNSIYSLLLSLDKKYLISSGNDQKIKFWNKNFENTLIIENKDSFQKLIILKDNRFCGGSGNGKIIILKNNYFKKTIYI